MEDWVDPVNNLVYCDLQGNFGYRTRGQVPQRAEANRWLPVPGWDGKHDWQGMVPFAEMPHTRNPQEGFAYSANNRITGADYPHYIGLDFAPEFRSLRIRQHLKEATNLGVDDMAAIHADVGSVPASHFASLWQKITPIDETSKQALACLQTWDGHVRADSPAPSIFAAFRLALVESVLEGLLPEAALKMLFQAVDRGANGLVQRLHARLGTLITTNDITLLSPGVSWPELMNQALQTACAELVARTGTSEPAQWQWGELHQTTPNHPLCAAFPQAAGVLNPKGFPMGGDGDTVQAAGYQAGLNFNAHFISVARYIFDAADWENSRWITPSGASGHPASAHYASQASLYAKGESLPMTYHWDTIKNQASTTQTLLPR